MKLWIPVVIAVIVSVCLADKHIREYLSDDEEE